MTFNASNFIQNRKHVFSVTDGRIKSILWYIIECYQLFKKDKITYSKSQIKESTTIRFEDYLKSKLVDNYLRKYRHLLNTNFVLEDVFFGKEETETYTGEYEIEQEDKIDIYVRGLGLQSLWNTNEEVYFAIECKRIKKLSDTKFYVEDIEKFSKRKHTNFRLLFEGQMAFIENKSITHNKAVNSINSRLENHAVIKTDSPLTYSEIYDSFKGSYLSKHRKNFNEEETFSIYHLMLDYSDIVID